MRARTAINKPFALYVLQLVCRTQESTKHVFMQGLSTFTISDDLVVYGGDKSGLAVCTMAGTDWKWTTPAITGAAFA